MALTSLCGPLRGLRPFFFLDKSPVPHMPMRRAFFLGKLGAVIISVMGCVSAVGAAEGAGRGAIMCVREQMFSRRAWRRWMQRRKIWTRNLKMSAGMYIVDMLATRGRDCMRARLFKGGR